MAEASEQYHSVPWLPIGQHHRADKADRHFSVTARLAGIRSETTNPQEGSTRNAGSGREL